MVNEYAKVGEAVGEGAGLGAGDGEVVVAVEMGHDGEQAGFGTGDSALKVDKKYFAHGCKVFINNKLCL